MGFESKETWILLLNLGQILDPLQPDFLIINMIFLTSIMGLGIEQIINVKKTS